MENERYIMNYEMNQNFKNVRILGKKFVKNNKNKGKIIYKNKMYSLRSLFRFKSFKRNNLKIQMILSNNCLNKSFMFQDCSSLLEIKYNGNIYNNDEYFVNNINNLYIGINKHNKINNENYERNAKIISMNEMFSNCSSLIHLPDISKWDTSNVIDMNKTFYNCESVPFLPDISEWDTRNVVDMSKMFYNCSSLLLLPDISDWNTGGVSNMDKMFYYCSSLLTLPDLSEWNNITNLNLIIKDCWSLISLPDIPNNKIKRIKNINLSSMFEKSCSIFKLIYKIKKEKTIKIFNTDFVCRNKTKCKIIIDNKIYLLTDKYKINNKKKKFLKIKLMILNNVGINMSHMFYDCNSLKKFYDISKKEIKPREIIKEEKNKNQNNNINEFNTKESENQIYNHFYNNNKSSKTPSEVCKNKISDKSYFHGRKRPFIPLIYSYDNLNVISDENREKIKKVFIRSFDFLIPSYLFYYSKFQKKDYINEASSTYSSISTTKRVSSPNKSKSLCEYIYYLKMSLLNHFKRNIFVTDMSYMFYGSSSLTSISGLHKLNTINVTSMAHIFEGCSRLKKIDDISQWKTNKVIDMKNMFKGCSSVLSLPDISKWNTDCVTNMSRIFYDCSSLLSLPDISNWNTYRVTNMNGIFAKCTCLKTLPDISKWNIGKVNYLSGIFYKCSSLVSIPDISKWNTNNAIYLNGMFFDCSSLLSLPDISKWNTKNVTYLGGMFSNCSLLKSLPDISKWNTMNVTNINNLFSGCSSLSFLPDISSWNTENVTEMSSLFNNCSSLLSLPDISKWKINNPFYIHCIFYNCSLLNSLPDISKWNTKNVTNMNSLFLIAPP